MLWDELIFKTTADARKYFDNKVLPLCREYEMICTYIDDMHLEPEDEDDLYNALMENVDDETWKAIIENEFNDFLWDCQITG